MATNDPLLIGAFALQGDFESHLRAALAAFPGSRTVEIRGKGDIPAGGLDLFLLPGGESSAFSLLIEFSGMRGPLEALLRSPRTVTLATCAGAILTAAEVLNPGRARTIPLVDISIERNAYGRQLDSFIGTLEPAPALARLAAHISEVEDSALEAVFIRAPKIRRVGPEAETLATVRGDPVLVRQGNILAATFHPEQSPASVVYGALRGMLAERAV